MRRLCSLIRVCTCLAFCLILRAVATVPNRINQEATPQSLQYWVRIISNVQILNDNRPAVTPAWCLIAMPNERSTRAGILSGCLSLDGRSRDAEVGFEPRTFRSIKAERRDWPKWLEHEFTDRKVRRSNLASASRLPLSRLGQPGSIPPFVLLSGDMAVSQRKGVPATNFDNTMRSVLEGEVTFGAIRSRYKRIDADVPLTHSVVIEKKESVQL
ncbi:LOW QUALITY PROTEIN: hypothetical protein T265_13302 [Opisthorchis viverrini]|uniref:Uncharacterized protein n=1 Tax=Opisthorchis viverrini TaxID=6198 RepID=A0A075A2J7_OPIVI|nr:LOW QUALITY PROTEIN: hypothetical protein T265_13302 [Opisthorchis viverrini]KER29760.1 LOW QUALITY PROTEIN: hypothetical protein T265_13302 [Opisthorchis viverrini]